MSYSVFALVPRTRSKIDTINDVEDVLSMDGTKYTINLGSKPVVSGSDLPINNGGVFLNHSTFTTGYDQPVYQNGFQPAFLSGINITYIPNYDRGKLSFYQGSGTFITPTGLVPFAPWNTSTLTVDYRTTKYKDSTLADYLSYAVAEVEASLQIGMYVSGITGAVPVVSPALRNQNDIVANQTGDPYSIGEVLVIGDAVEVVQELISSRAALDLIQSERRIGVGAAIKLRDGDTEIDSSANQKYFDSLYKDLKLDYENKLKFVMQNMLEGYSIRQINESAATIFGSSRFNSPGYLPFPDYAIFFTLGKLYLLSHLLYTALC